MMRKCEQFKYVAVNNYNHALQLVHLANWYTIKIFYYYYAFTVSVVGYIMHFWFEHVNISRFVMDLQQLSISIGVIVVHKEYNFMCDCVNNLSYS